MQHGSAPQIGVGAGEVDPAANQQQQPLQSVHDASVGSGLHTALHDEASPPVLDVAASVVPVDPPESVGSFDPLPLPLLEGPVVPVVLLLQAASPTVDDAPMTTITWKRFSIFMKHTVSSDG